ncbi:MAG TPA: hypothetical protein VF765_06855 [Polyangiaceae bacterium]
MSAVRAASPQKRGWLTVAEGIVDDVSRGTLMVGDDVTLAFELPERVKLDPLAGTHVRVALQDEVSLTGPKPQTLVMTDARGHALLVARYGPAGQVHAIGTMRVRAALSQRHGGPMTFGTEALQYLVHVGEHVRMRGPDGDLVICFAARTAFDYVAYAIVDTRLWVSGRR